jgi:hypothetical protein
MSLGCRIGPTVNGRLSRSLHDQFPDERSHPWPASADNREAVDELVEKALATGASPSKLASDEGFMYSRGFLDPDGHLWDVVWMDPSAIEP